MERQEAKGKRQKAKVRKSTTLLPFAFCLLPFALQLSSQTFTQRGFLETRLTLYPQGAPSDSGGATNEWLLRYEPSWKPAPLLSFQASLDARTDTPLPLEPT